MYQLLDLYNQTDLVDFSVGLLAAALVWLFGLPAKKQR